MRKACLNDLDAIMEIIQATVQEMKTYGNTQWDETYPGRQDFIEDIQKGDLYIKESATGLLQGFICLNQVEPAEYAELTWSLPDKPWVIHRMAVNPQCRRQGIGSQLIKFAEDYACNQGTPYMKTDTNSINDKMNHLFQKNNYSFVGEMQFLGKETPFYCYEKRINVAK